MQRKPLSALADPGSWMLLDCTLGAFLNIQHPVSSISPRRRLYEPEASIYPPFDLRRIRRNDNSTRHHTAKSRDSGQYDKKPECGDVAFGAVKDGAG
jgi:hypothetical protein